MRTLVTISLLAAALTAQQVAVAEGAAPRLREVGEIGIAGPRRLFPGAGGLWITGNDDAGPLAVACTARGCGAARRLPCEATGLHTRRRGEHYLTCYEGGIWRLVDGREPERVVDLPVSALAASPAGLFVGTDGQGIWYWRYGAPSARRLADFRTYCSRLLIGGGEVVAMGAEEYRFDLLRISLATLRARRVVDAPAASPEGGPPFPHAGLRIGGSLWLLSDPNYSTFDLYRLDRSDRWSAWTRGFPPGRAAASRGAFWILDGQTLHHARPAGMTRSLRLGMAPEAMLASGGYLWFLDGGRLLVATERRLGSACS